MEVLGVQFFVIHILEHNGGIYYTVINYSMIELSFAFSVPSFAISFDVTKNCDMFIFKLTNINY